MTTPPTQKPDFDKLGTLPPERLKSITQFGGELDEVNRLADALGQVVSGDFGLTLRTSSSHPVVQKLAIMGNFMLQSVRQAISQRERAEASLKGQSFLRQLLDLQTDLIFTLDLEGRVVIINQAAADFFGLEAEAFIGKRPTEMDTPYQAYAEAIIRVSRRVASTGQPIFIDEQQLAATNGKANWFQSSHVPVLGEDGKVAQVLSVMTDITARKESAEQMLTMVKDLQQALKFKDEFMAVMSHELRTPLNAIVGFSGIALMTGDASAQTTKMLERIDFNARRLVSLINDLLDLSRINAGRVEILWADSDIHELAQAWYENFRERIISKGVTFTLDIDPALPKVISTDPDRLTQVASNLLTNAAKFTETGSVTLSLKMLGADRWMMTVADTGIGISEAYQQAIFEEFRQVEAGMQSKYGGTGLGLAIVQKLCVLMDGQIKVKSKLGEGSTFTATFPLRTAGGQGAA